MADHVDYLIVGGGVAAVRCAATLRSEGARGRIVMLAAEPDPPYSRPPLSKGLLLGVQKPEQIFIVSEDYYERNGIELVLEARVDQLDADRKTAYVRGREYVYDQALIATGCDPLLLDVPGADLEGIFYLRTLRDSNRIKRAMEGAKRAAIVGAGFIGMELASAFVQNNIATSMIVREDRLWGKLGSHDISDFFKKLYESEGVELFFNEEAERFEGEGGRVGKVVTKSGKEIPCDLLCVGIGVSPATGFVQGSRIEVKNGVITDEYLVSGDPSVFAAGDVANYRDPVFGTMRRIEHWDHAIKQGGYAAMNMLGQRRRFETLSYFFSDIFNIHYEFVGDNRDIDEVEFYGSFDDRAVVGLYLKGGRLKAGFLLGAMVQERPTVERLIMSGQGIGDYLKDLTRRRPGGRAA